MKGMPHLKVGSYRLSDHLKLTVRACDDGTAVTVQNLPVGTSVSAVISEHGVVSHHSASLCTSAPTPEKSAPSSLAALSAPPLTIEVVDVPPTKQGTAKPKQVRFTLRYTKRARPQNRPRVLGGFTNGSVMNLIYRIQAGGAVHEENQLRLDGEHAVIGGRVPQDELLPKTEWAKFLGFSDQTTFRLGDSTTIWRKVSSAEVAERIEEKVIHLAATPACPLLAKERDRPERGRSKAKEVVVVACEAVNLDHDDGDSAVSMIVAHKGEIEPLVMSLDDARKLAAQLLVALWTNDDGFAEELLMTKFPVSDDGQFRWPKPT